MLGACTVALGLHIKQRYEMRHYASKVVQRIEKEGGKVLVEGDRLTILMDGKVQEVLSANDREGLEHAVAPKKHLQSAIMGVMAGEKTEFKFYKTVIKQELKDANPSVYALILSSDTTLKARPYGTSVRTNMAGKSQVQKDP